MLLHMQHPKTEYSSKHLDERAENTAETDNVHTEINNAEGSAD